MRISSVKCPNCGASISITPGLRQTYCKYCDSLLVIEGNELPEENSKNHIERMDNPISVEIVESENKGVRVWGDGIHDVYVLSGISYLLDSSIPRMPVQYKRKWRFIQRCYLGGLIKGKWKLTQEPPEETLPGDCERWRFSCKKDEGKKEESQPVFYKARYKAQRDYNEKWVNQDVTYYVKALPDSIKNYTDLYRIVDNSKTNKNIQGMLETIIQDLPNAEELSVSIKRKVMEGDGVSVYNRNISNFYRLHTFGLDDCTDRLHRDALLAIVVAGILKKKGNMYSLYSVEAQLNEDHDVCLCTLTPIKIVKKNYQSW